MTTEIQTTLAQEQTRIEAALAAIRTLEVKDQAALTQVNEWLVKTKRRAKEIEAQRVSITKPQNDALRATNALFKPVLDLYDKFARALGAKVAEGTAELERQAAAQVRAAAEAHQAGNTTQAVQLLMAAPEDPTHTGTSIRKVWKFEITDPAAVPHHLCSPDERKIRGVVDAGAREIPGVRVFQTDELRVRT